MVGLGQVEGLAYVDVEGNPVVPEVQDAFLVVYSNQVLVEELLLGHLEVVLDVQVVHEAVLDPEVLAGLHGMAFLVVDVARDQVRAFLVAVVLLAHLVLEEVQVVHLALDHSMDLADSQVEVVLDLDDQEEDDESLALVPWVAHAFLVDLAVLGDLVDPFLVVAFFGLVSARPEVVDPSSLLIHDFVVDVAGVADAVGVVAFVVDVDYANVDFDFVEAQALVLFYIEIRTGLMLV